MGKLIGLAGRSVRHAQRLFHFLVSLVFLFLASAGGLLTFREWTYYEHNHAGGLGQFGFILGFTVLLTVLSLYSLLKARSVR